MQTKSVSKNAHSDNTENKKNNVLARFGFSLNASIINYCFSSEFMLFEEYYCSEDDLFEIYALQNEKLVTDIF